MKKPKTFNLWSKVRSALRKVWMYSPARRDALKAAKADNLYLCVSCVPPKLHEKWAMDVDHVEPCGPLASITDVQTFTDRLFNGKLKAICKPCHAIKTKEQRKHAC